MNGAGGTQVGPFSASATLPASFMVTNWNAITAINRATPLTISWTGAGVDVVIIIIAGRTTANSTINSVSLTCPVAASAGSYTIPTSALGLLPATTMGFLSVTGGPSTLGAFSALYTSQSFTPSLVGGGSINYGAFGAFLEATKGLTVQ